MKSFKAFSCSTRMPVLRLIRAVAVMIVGVMWVAQAQTQDFEGDTSRWLTFTSRGGWSIRYPPSLHVSSCRQCEDPTAPNVIVSFSAPSGQILVMIDPLADKNAQEDTRQWLHEVGHDTVLSPVRSEDWAFIDGALALIVMNGPADATGTENTYIAHGVKTFAVRFPHIQEASIRSTCRQMLSTLRFSWH